MKYLKTLRLATLAAMAVMAFIGAGTASATELYSGATTLKVGTVIDATLTGSISLTTTEGTILDTCTGGTVKTSITSTGSSTGTGKTKTEAVTWSGCSEPTTTIALGSGGEIHWISGTHNGTMTSLGGREVTVNTTIFGSCVYAVEAGKSEADVHGTTLNNGKMAVDSIAMRKSGLCPSSARWIGTYEITSPSPLNVASS
jgi:hypothetical protein